MWPVFYLTLKHVGFFICCGFILTSCKGISVKLSAPDLLNANIVFTQKDQITSISENMLPKSSLSGVAAVKLQSGIILFQNANYLEAWNPATGEWVLKASPPVNTSQPVGFLLPDGRVLFVSESLVSSLIYSPADDSWLNLGAVASARSYPSFTQLNDGKVYVVGGYNGGTSYNQLYIFDPATSSWTQGTSITVQRASAMAGALADGRMIVTGGWNFNSGPLSSAEIYNPTTNTWSGVSNMIQNRAYGMATVMKNGRYMVMGGAQNTSWLSSNSVQYFDTNTNAFINLANMNRPRYTTIRPSKTIVLDNGKVVVGATGGTSGAGVGLEIYDPVADTWEEVTVPSGVSVTGPMIALDEDSFMLINGETSKIYNTVTGLWSALQRELSTHRITNFRSHRLPNGNIFMYGGSSSQGDQTTSIFSLSVGQMTAGPDLPQYRSNPLWISSVSGHGPVMIGGSNGSDPDAQRRVHSFDNKTMSWTTLPLINEGRNGDSQGVRLKNGSIFITGGYDVNGLYGRTSELYLTNANQWLLIPEIDTLSRYGAPLSELPDGRIILVGGYHYNEYYDAGLDEWLIEEEYLATTHIFDPQSLTWSSGPALNTSRVNHVQITLGDGKIFICGGYDSLNQLYTAELFDPETMTWSSVADTPYVINSTTMHKSMFDGRILFWGLNNGTKAAIYNPHNDTWKELTPSLARGNGQIIDLEDGKYLVIGGIINSTGKTQYGWDIFEPYTPVEAPHELTQLVRTDHHLLWLLSGKWLLPRSTKNFLLKFNNEYETGEHQVNFTFIE